MAFTRNSYDSSELPPPLGHYYYLDQFAIAVQRNAEGPALSAAINGAREAPHYFAAQCYLAGAYNKVALPLLQQAGVAQWEEERPDLVIEAYEKCVAGNLANPMSYQAYADALMGLGRKDAALQVLQRMLLNCHAHPRLGGLQRMYDAYSNM